MEVPEVTIDGCKFNGKWDVYGYNVAQFYSIPYSKPPINEFRWSPPRSITNYTQQSNICNDTTNYTFNATYHHSRCYQLKFGNATGSYPPQSENCLHLNIFSPSFNSSDMLPIMVYFHGGSSVSGGNFMWDYTNFSVTSQIVVVVPNYRLQLLGFLSFSALSSTSNTLSSGNYGLMDLKLSLQWIQKHISLFGGNPDNVTIFGHSTGGTAVLSMLSSPSTKGLFHRAIPMSGSPNISMDLQTAEKQGATIVDIFGCNKSSWTAQQIVSCMRSIDAENITNSYPQQWSEADAMNFGLPGPDKTGFHEAGLMIVDGFMVTQSIFDALRNGINHVPLIIGNTQYETDFMPYYNVCNLTTKNEFIDYLNQQFIEWGQGFGQHILDTYYNEEWNLGESQLTYDGIGSDSTGFCGTKYLATIAADSSKYESSVYLYSFQQWPSHPWQQSINWNCSYSFHSLGLFASTFTWNAFKYWGALNFNTEFIDNAFGENIRNHWTHFIKYNSPLSIWKQYNKINNYNVALLGNGPNKYTMYNLTNMTNYYKHQLCQFYINNSIGPTFWWSN